MARHYYSDTAVSTTLSAGISNSATTVTVSSASGFPGSFPYYLAIDRGTGSMEVIEVTNAVTTTLTVVRGVSSTSAVSHSSGAAVEHVAPAVFYNEDSAHVNTATGVHGVSGDIVGTTATQTLSGKTISGATNTFSSIPKAAITGAPAGAFVGTTDTQSLTNKTLDATNVVAVAAVTGLVARLAILETTASMIVYTASGSFTSIQAASAKAICVRCIGGGGAGGGAAITGAGVSSAGGGGQAGTYSESVVATSGLTFPVTVTVGAGGVGALGTTGGNGGATSFGTAVTAPGGIGGQTSSAAATIGFIALGGTGAAAGTGQISAVGCWGGLAWRIAVGNAMPGTGGASALGGASWPAGGSSDGSPGAAYGAGGGGGNNVASQATARTGGNGAAGLVTVELIY